MLPEYTEEQLVQVARDFVAQGEDKLKMVVGVAGDHQGWREDSDRVHAVRDAIGPGVQLSMDANYMFQFNNALNLAKAVEECNVEWFEEPVWGNDAPLLHELRMRTSIPISAGQNEGHRFRARELLVHQAVDILQPNVVYCGGYTEGMKFAALAQAFNLPIANGGGWPHHNMHLQAAVPNGWRIEYHYVMWKCGEMVFDGCVGPATGLDHDAGDPRPRPRTEVGRPRRVARIDRHSRRARVTDCPVGLMGEERVVLGAEAS